MKSSPDSPVEFLAPLSRYPERVYAAEILTPFGPMALAGEDEALLAARLNVPFDPFIDQIRIDGAPRSLKTAVPSRKSSEGWTIIFPESPNRSALWCGRCPRHRSFAPRTVFLPRYPTAKPSLMPNSRKWRATPEPPARPEPPAAGIPSSSCTRHRVIASKGLEDSVRARHQKTPPRPRSGK